MPLSGDSSPAPQPGSTAAESGDGPNGDASGPSDGGGSSERSLLADPRLTIAKRDLASLRSEKTIVLALLIQLFVAAFSSFLVVGLTSLYSPGSVSAGEVVVGVAGEHDDALVRAAENQQGVRAVVYPNPEAAREAYHDGNVHATLLAGDSAGRIGVEVIAPTGSIETTLIVDQVRTLLESVERTERIARTDHLDTPPVPLPENVDASPYFGFTYTVLVPLLLFLPPFISGSVAVDALTEEIERGTLELLRVAPLSLVDIVDGKALAMVLIAPAQAVLWIALLSTNGIGVANVPQILLVVTALTTLVVTLGLSLGVLTAKRRQAQLLYSVLVIFGFGLLTFAPEHPATTVAKLAVDSPTTTTTLHVAAYAVAAVVLFVGARRLVARTDPEGL
ncbi:ABC-type transport system permease protein 2 [Halosimplex carlsbadense 2-9-1]|uniref:ABC-type transport system permease protein 2 n=1 Tax=Halosimplex carlsbadense 2-9-1 TaxID=797114 RepID=M0CND6_9EURY|nr:ABC-type transport system permease protein 2 [Halosimplex carlsbadense 2-9-1]